VLALAWILIFLPLQAWWAYLIFCGLMYAGMTTYWDWLFKGEDNFYMHGFMIAFAYLPLAILSGGWPGFGIRCVVLALAMGILCAVFGDVDVEEYGRGAFIAASLPLLLVGI
jgi:hypothetical protein